MRGLRRGVHTAAIHRPGLLAEVPPHVASRRRIATGDAQAPVTGAEGTLASQDDPRCDGASPAPGRWLAGPVRQGEKTRDQAVRTVCSAVSNSQI